jgi:H(+)-transporting ATP synthase subunit D
MIRTGPLKVTRSSLMRLSRQLDQVRKGTALLERKRDALVLEMFAHVRPTIDARHRVEQQAATAYAALVDALAASGRADLAALGWPSRELRVGIATVEGTAPTAAPARFLPPRTLVRGAAARLSVPGQTDPAADKAAQAFERFLELVLATAPEEAAMHRLGRMLAHTVRQVNVLEQRVAVDLARALLRVRRTLDEREREEITRLRHIAARARR